MKICPRNAKLYGYDVPQKELDEWCKRVRGPSCAGCDKYDCIADKNTENTDTKKEQLKLF